MKGLNFSRRRALPLIMQSEASDCGLACLAMIAKYHGHDVDLNGLRQRFPVSLNGASVADISDLAGGLDFTTRALRVDLSVISNLKMPAILHWHLNHFVVLKKVVGRTIHINDPASGSRTMSVNEVSDHFTGVAIEFTPVANFKPQVAKQKMRLSDLWGNMVGLKRAIFQLVILSLTLQFISLIIPFYLQLVVDEVVVKFDQSLLTVLAIAFGALIVIQQVTSLMREWTILYYGHQMSFQMVSNVFNHLVNLPADYFEKRHIGDILSRIGSTNPIQKALTQSLIAAFIDGIMAILTGLVIFLYSPILGLVVLASVALLLLTTLIFYPLLRSSQEKMIVSEANESTFKIETIRAFVPLKLFSAQNQRLSTWGNLFAEYVNDSVSFGKHNIVLKVLQDLIVGLQTILIVYLGARYIISGDSNFTVGMLFAFLAYRTNFSNSVVSLFNTYIEFRLLNVHLERISDIAHSEREYEGHTSSMEKGTRRPPKLEVRDLLFRYGHTDPFVLNGLNFSIKSGDFVAITGPSGGGKTTLLKLLLGLYAPTQGKILIDELDMSSASPSEWRQCIGVVMQDDRLFSGTLAENIAFFSQSIDIEKVHKVAQQAQIHKEIMMMPMKYHSLVGDMGSALSGGQKQRVLLARALYREPSVLILDEGTANLDVYTEKVIVDIISSLDITRIVVAHRDEFLKQASVILEVSHGNIKEVSYSSLSVSDSN